MKRPGGYSPEDSPRDPQSVAPSEAAASDTDADQLTQPVTFLRRFRKSAGPHHTVGDAQPVTAASDDSTPVVSVSPVRLTGSEPTVLYRTGRGVSNERHDPSADEHQTVDLAHVVEDLGAAAQISESVLSDALPANGETVSGRTSVGASLRKQLRFGFRRADAVQSEASLQPVNTEVVDRVDPVVEAEQELKRAERARKTRERKDKRRFTAHRRSRLRSWLVGAGAVLLLAAMVVIGVFTPLMAVRDVEVVGASQVDPAEVQQALGRFEGVPLALVGDVELHRALEPFPLIQRYSVERIPPHTLRVHIEERQPVIAISGDSGYRLLDAAGVLTGEVAELPAGIVRASGGVIDSASAAFAEAAVVVRDIPEDVRVQMAEVSASSEQDIEFLLHSGVTVVWGESEDTQRKAVVLRAMLASVPAATRIDLSAPEAPVFQ